MRIEKLAAASAPLLQGCAILVLIQGALTDHLPTCWVGIGITSLSLLLYWWAVQVRGTTKTVTRSPMVNPLRHKFQAVQDLLIAKQEVANPQQAGLLHCGDIIGIFNQMATRCPEDRHQIAQVKRSFYDLTRRCWNHETWVMGPKAEDCGKFQMWRWYEIEELVKAMEAIPNNTQS